MLTIEKLRQFGADTGDGLERCMNNEAFYLRLVNMALEDGNYRKLTDALASGDYKAAFHAAHTLKGVLANLSLTPLYGPVSEITELLRGGGEADCAALLDELLSRREALLRLREE